jgi:hypothetical protein
MNNEGTRGGKPGENREATRVGEKENRRKNGMKKQKELLRGNRWGCKMMQRRKMMVMMTMC